MNKPKKLRHELNIDENANGKPFAFYDSDTPFPTMNQGDELRIVNRRFRVTAVRHEVTESTTHVHWLITATVTDLE